MRPFSRPPKLCDCGRKLIKVDMADGKPGWGCPFHELVWLHESHSDGNHWWIWDPVCLTEKQKLAYLAEEQKRALSEGGS
jgi:hypothetical protein